MDEIKPPSEKNDILTIEEIIKMLEEILYSRQVDEASIQNLQSGHRVIRILQDLLSLRSFITELSKGDLSCKLNMKGYLAGTLKSLQANLKHLTWQTKMVAEGDMSQRVDFLGEFSDAFNNMVKKLDETMKNLKKKEAELSKINEALMQEISRRRALEQTLRESEEKYKSLSQIDPLTGIYNRRQFFILANMEFKKALRYGRDLSILMLDLDFFKRINDTYGHAIGDRVLQLTAKIIKENLRSVDIFARYGGEEFVIVLPETNLTGALQVAERIRSNIEKTPLTVNDKVEINITISIGLCSETVKKSESTSIEKIIEKADQSLYEAKRLGRNRVCIYSHSLP